MGRRRRLGTPAACTFTPDVRSRTGESTDGSRGASNIRGRRIGQVIRGRQIARGASPAGVGEGQARTRQAVA